MHQKPNLELEKTEVMGFLVFSDSLNKIQSNSSSKVINTINAFSYALSKKDEKFKNALEQSDILLPDGFPFEIASKFLLNKEIKKIAGEDIFYHLLKQEEAINGSVFFLGSTENTLSLIKGKLRKEFPSIEIRTYSPPFKESFTVDDNLIIHNKINEFRPNVLFVGMTAPKQEKWVHDNKGFLSVRTICSIGAVFDFYAETISRPSYFWIKFKLEWFKRFSSEPIRLWKRYFIYSPIFFIDMIKHKLFQS